MSACPRCASEGRPIEAATLTAQVLEDRLAGLQDHHGWHLCTSEGCAVVYFRAEDAVVLGETRALPFHKSAAPERLVCFCFGRSVAEIEAEVHARGSSAIQASIKAACKAGLDDCARKNPQGRCCLGNVGSVIKGAAPGAAGDSGRDGDAAPDCCGDSSPSSD